MLHIAKEVFFFFGSVVAQRLVLVQYRCLSIKEFKKKVLHLSMTLLLVHAAGATGPNLGNR